MNKLILIFLILLGLRIDMQSQTPATAASSDTISTERIPSEADAGIGVIALLPVDTILAAHRVQIEADTIREWKKKKEFSYLRNLDSLLKVLQDKENAAAAAKATKPRRSPVNDFLEAPILKTLFIMLALFFVAVILYHLLKDQAIFRRSSPALPAREMADDEDEELQNDYDKLVHQAYKLGDYRMAVRYLFLKTLQQLRDQHIIEFSPDKTNSRYSLEVPAPLRDDFSRLVLHYEYAWYGNFEVSREQFSLIQKQYSAFLHKI